MLKVQNLCVCVCVCVMGDSQHSTFLKMISSKHEVIYILRMIIFNFTDLFVYKQCANTLYLRAGKFENAVCLCVKKLMKMIC
jgi:hypothetical protein